MAKFPYLNVARLRKDAQQSGKRLSKTYLTLLNAKVDSLHAAALEVHNGGKKTLDPAVAAYVGIIPSSRRL